MQNVMIRTPTLPQELLEHPVETRRVAPSVTWVKQGYGANWSLSEMAGQVVHLKNPKSAQQIADEETKLKAPMLKWADDIASSMIGRATAARRGAAVMRLIGYGWSS